MRQFWSSETDSGTSQLNSAHSVHGVNAFALPVTLMVTVEIKHRAPDSAAEKAGSFKERVRAGLPSCSALDFLGYPSQPRGASPREGNEGHCSSFLRPGVEVDACLLGGLTVFFSEPKHRS